MESYFDKKAHKPCIGMTKEEAVTKYIETLYDFIGKLKERGKKGYELFCHCKEYDEAERVSREAIHRAKLSKLKHKESHQKTQRSKNDLLKI